jgi:hypothetical protein
MRLKRSSLSGSLVVAAFLSVIAACAQEETNPPIGASGAGKSVASSQGVSVSKSGLPDSIQQSTPDTHALTGDELYGLGSTGRAHDLLDPSLFVIETGSEGGYTSTNGQIASFTSVGGSLSLTHLWSHSTLLAAYDGTRNFNSVQNAASSNSNYQSMGISNVFDAGRWTLRIRNDFTYSPQSPYGNSNLGGPGLNGQVGSSGTLGDVSPDLGSAQTIQTGQADRVGDTGLAEIDYSFTRRAQFTLSGGYGLLKFLQPGYLDSHDIIGKAGYSYSVNAKDTWGLTAAYDRTAFSVGTALQNSQFGLAYGRKVTGRLAFQSSGGATLIHYVNFAPPLRHAWNWTAAVSMAYDLRRNGYNVSYSRGVTNGSGVLAGATTHNFGGAYNHRFSRFTSGTINGGYTLSNSLVQSATLANSYKTWYAGAALSRQFGHHISANLNYGAQEQIQGAGLCPVASCATSNNLRHTFGFSASWHPRPLQID